MKKNKIAFLILTTFIIVLIDDAAFAQCAMCKAVPTSEMESGGSQGSGLNTGILYLLAIPYVLISGFILIFFRKQIIQKISAFRLKLNKA